MHCLPGILTQFRAQGVRLIKLRLHGQHHLPSDLHVSCGRKLGRRWVWLFGLGFEPPRLKKNLGEFKERMRVSRCFPFDNKGTTAGLACTEGGPAFRSKLC